MDSRSLTMALQRLGALSVLVLALAPHGKADALDDRQPAASDAGFERCADAARATCAKVATDMIASIELTCGHFGLGWACLLGRAFWNAPRDKDAEWVDRTCRQEAVKQCAAAKPKQQP
jgi:hypothetical protein